jgi:hypothetical protein
VAVDTAVVDVPGPMGETEVLVRCWKIGNQAPRSTVVGATVVVVEAVVVVEVVKTVTVSAAPVVKVVVVAVMVVKTMGVVPMIQLHTSDNRELGTGMRTNRYQRKRDKEEFQVIFRRRQFLQLGLNVSF